MPSAPESLPTPTLKQLAWQIPFSGLVWSSAFGVMVGTSVVSAVRRNARTPTEQSLWSAKAFAQVLKLTRADVDLRYDPGFDRDRPSVFCQNHVSVMDAHVACHSIPQPFVGLMLAWHFKIPGYGWMMRSTNGIPVYPAKAGRTQALTDAAKDRAGKGLSILTFPEGHRTVDGNMRELKRGIFFMARDAGLPVTALAVRGMHLAMRKGSMLISPAKLQVHVGPQIETAGLDDDGVRELALVLGEAMSAFVTGGDEAGSALSALAGWTPGARAAEVRVSADRRT